MPLSRSPNSIPPALYGVVLRQLAASTGVVAGVAALGVGILWQVDGCRTRANARARAEVWGRGVAEWEVRLDNPVPSMRDSAIAALRTFAERDVIPRTARARLSRHLAQRLADAAPDTRMLAVIAALQMAESDGDAARALRGSAAGVLATAAGAPARVAALEVLARLGAAPDDLDLVTRVARTDPDTEAGALAATVVERAGAPRGAFPDGRAAVPP